MKTSHGPYYALIEWFARNSVAANLLMFILLLGGLYSAVTIKKESQPPIDTNFITVSIPFLGSSPEDVEEGILIKIEEGIQDIEGIEEIISTGRRGSGTVQIEVRSGYDVPEVMNEIKSRVDAISTFPDNTENPIISRTRFQQQVNLVSVYGDVDERTLKEYAKQILHMTKGEIILTGISLGVDYATTHSCYDPDREGVACGECDSCRLRLKGFAEAGIKDPVPYKNRVL